MKKLNWIVGRRELTGLTVRLPDVILSSLVQQVLFFFISWEHFVFIHNHWNLFLGIWAIIYKDNNNFYFSSWSKLLNLSNKYWSSLINALILYVQCYENCVNNGVLRLFLQSYEWHNRFFWRIPSDMLIIFFAFTIKL